MPSAPGIKWPWSRFRAVLILVVWLLPSLSLGSGFSEHHSSDDPAAGNQEVQPVPEENAVPEGEFFLSALERQPSDAYQDTLTPDEPISSVIYSNVSVEVVAELPAIDPALLFANVSSNTEGDGPGGGSQGVPASDMPEPVADKVPDTDPFPSPLLEKPQGNDDGFSWQEYLLLTGLYAATLPVTPHASSRKRKRRPSPGSQRPQDDDEQRELRPRTVDRGAHIHRRSPADIRPETGLDELKEEVKRIYRDLVAIEDACKRLDAQHAAKREQPLTNPQWQALIALHRTLLHEHRDFFATSRHPNASPALRRLAVKYRMPARMWRHGVHSFLELLRHQLPHSLPLMVSFIEDVAYPAFFSLYHESSHFEATWMECLGDVARYRLSIEREGVDDREIWTSIARVWYKRTSDVSPTVGRLYHHLAILARPNPIEQLYYYFKSLCVAVPFLDARGSIMTLFDPILSGSPSPVSTDPVLSAFIRAHALLFTGGVLVGRIESVMGVLLPKLNAYIEEVGVRWAEIGYQLGIMEGCSILGYGWDDSALATTSTQASTSSASQADAAREETPNPLPGPSNFVASTYRDSIHLAYGLSTTMLRRFSDPNILPYLHVTLCFLHHGAQSGVAMETFLSSYPWEELSVVLNYLAGQYGDPLESVNPFPVPGHSGNPRPLPEDFALRGMPWTEQYFPQGWFSGDYCESDYNGFDCFDLRPDREARILWLGVQLARRAGYLDLDAANSQFAASGGASSSCLSHQASYHAHSEASTSSASISGPSFSSPSSSGASNSATQTETPSQDSSESKPFRCGWQDCPRAFKLQGELNHHVKTIHTKPIACESAGCSYRCGTPRDLKRHYQVHHPDMVETQVFSCDLCPPGRDFNRKDNLARHQKTFHGADQ
ncbi:hypothetical protein QBC34DRAFT_147379 [Podospora aff. communis PSN243]|uniref:Nonsense-mediated mRNA decay factor n=1 Tax=Podospora aff. communis PSN243 TaxID=3040156 RepID=A0AAV9GFP6_9PEZI|nr:hypothetical protein QBC34DRAFT_147379 [Podospora aff. communis PSN243]